MPDGWRATPTPDPTKPKAPKKVKESMTPTTPPLASKASTEPSEGEVRANLLAQLKKTRRDGQVLAWADEETSRCRNARAPLERKWYTNLSFYFGKQYVEAIRSTQNNAGFSFVTPKAPPWRVRLVINKVRVAVRTEIAKLTAGHPIPSVVPATLEDEDAASARVGESLLKSLLNNDKFAKAVRSWIWWGSICGTSFLKVYWSPNEKADSGAAGVIKVERVDPFHILIPDTQEEDLENQSYVIHLQTRSTEWVKQFYKVEAPGTTNEAGGVMSNAFLNLMGTQDINKDAVLIREIWIKPGATSLYPKGGMLIIVGDKVVYDYQEGLPYRHNEFPFYKYDGIPTGQFYRESMVTDLISPQKEYNRRRSQIVEAANMMGKPQLMAQRGSINPRMMTSEPGQVILVLPGYQMPTPLQMQPLPAYVVQELDRLNGEMDDISGQHDISRGQNPSQVTAATAISYLQEQDDTKLAYQAASIEDAITKLGRHYLKLIVQYWDEPRMIRIVGDDGAFEAKMWQGSDLRGNTDVRVQAGSSLPQSKAAKTALLMDLFKMGGIEAPKLMEMLDIGGIEKVYEEMLVDKRQAQRENLRMAEADPAVLAAAQQQALAAAQQYADQANQQAMAAYEANPPQDTSHIDPTTGQPLMDANGMALPPMAPPGPPAPIDPHDDPELHNPITVEVNSWDNHAAHVQFHNTFRKTQSYEMLDELIQQDFEKHVAMHQAAMVGTQGPMGPLGPDGIPLPEMGMDPSMDPNAQPPQNAGVPNG